jgi:HSP20 family protein
MSNVTVRKEQHPATMPTASIDPWDRWARSLFGWDPFRELAPMQAMDRSFMPSFEIKETKEGYLFKADLPGVKENDLEVTFTANRLTVKGKREEEKKQETDTYYCYERHYGTFSRSFTLPEGCDGSKAHAELKEGVLTLLVPKTPEAQPKKIDVKSGK